ncbi:MAG: hypothetical protein RUMPE_00602 [Eubacteriales bacterium SKADARSKE-1]|nr:hypothetical protein [Eubacteriales bacterium SKADARSKE-1]
MFCTNCGKKVPFKTKTCPFCDSEIIIENESEQDDEENQALESNNVETDEEKENDDKSLNDQEQAVIEETDDNLSKENVKTFFPHYSKYDVPLSTASFFFMQLVFFIPVINIFLLLIWSFKKNTNRNRKAYSRSILIWFLSISVILSFLLIIMIIMRYPIGLGFWFQEFKKFINTIPEF